MKLSKAQQYMLDQAFIKRRRDAMYHNPESGWFYPSHYETASVYGVCATAAVLCGKGLLEYKTVSYHKSDYGEWKPVNEYRITETGKQHTTLKG